MVKVIEIALLALCGVFLFTLMLIGAADVVLGKVFGRPIPGMFEISEVLVALTTLLALPVVTGRGDHVTVDIIFVQLKGKFKKFARIVALIAMGLSCYLFAHPAWVAFTRSWRVKEVSAGPVPVPIYPLKFAAFAVFCLCIALAIYFLANEFRHLKMKEVDLRPNK